MQPPAKKIYWNARRSSLLDGLGDKETILALGMRKQRGESGAPQASIQFENGLSASLLYVSEAKPPHRQGTEFELWIRDANGSVIAPPIPHVIYDSSPNPIGTIDKGHIREVLDALAGLPPILEKSGSGRAL